MKKQPKLGADIIQLITGLTQQIAALDKKVDALAALAALANRPLPQLKPVSQPPVDHANVQAGMRPDDRHKARQMFQATCADCKNECQIPFKPSGDRPVYCKECFSRRRVSNSVKVIADNKPKEMPPVMAVVNASDDIKHAPVKAAKKPPAPKKVAARKKPAAKKKK